MNRELSLSCRRSAALTLDWIEARMQADGSLGADCADLACYYKPPYLMQLAGRAASAHRLLDQVTARFQRPNGDFRTADEIKTADPVLSLYPGYINGWLTIAAHKLGRFELSYPAWSYLLGFGSGASGGFRLAHASDPDADGTYEVLMCAHLGLAALYLGDLRRARDAGLMLCRFLDAQPAAGDRFFLRMSAEGELLTEFPDAAAGLHLIAADQPGQAWFFIGYPLAFLARLYQVTGEQALIDAARGYFAFAERCSERMHGEHFAHKVAWGAAELAGVTGDAAHWALAEAIVPNLIAAQCPDGSWLADQPMLTRVDQSAEVAIWLLEIGALAR